MIGQIDIELTIGAMTLNAIEALSKESGISIENVVAALIEIGLNECLKAQIKSSDIIEVDNGGKMN